MNTTETWAGVGGDTVTHAANALITTFELRIVTYFTNK